MVQDYSMVVRQCRVYWSRLWTATETVGVVCSTPYRPEQDAVTCDLEVIYTAQCNECSIPHHSTSSDATYNTLLLQTHNLTTAPAVMLHTARYYYMLLLQTHNLTTAPSVMLHTARYYCMLLLQIYHPSI